MEKFNIEIKEILVQKITIESNSVEDALLKARLLYNEEKIVLDYSNHIDTIISETSTDDTENLRISLTNEVIDYLISEERKHFEELGSVPQDHIYLKLLQLKAINNN